MDGCAEQNLAKKKSKVEIVAWDFLDLVITMKELDHEAEEDAVNCKLKVAQSPQIEEGKIGDPEETTPYLLKRGNPEWSPIRSLCKERKPPRNSVEGHEKLSSLS